MPYPSITDIPEGAWIKVATAVKAMRIQKQKRGSFSYFHAYGVYDGETPPTFPPDDSQEIIWETDTLEFTHTEDCDFFLKCKGGDGVVRVEI